MAKVDPRVRRLIIQKARKYKIDPQAALAVAAGEGGIRWGAVGDDGTSFGPFQLHVGGALPKGKDARWANSPAGIDYALRKMAEAGAAGLRGSDAVNAIVRKFERPADPDTSVANAVARLGKIPAPSPVNVTAPAPMPANELGQALSPQARGTLNDIFTKVGLKPLDIVGNLPLPATSVPGQRTATPSPKAKAAPAPFTGPKGKMPRVNLMLAAITKAQQLGLRVSENPYVDGVDPVHVKGSHHYQVIGTRGKKKVGGAIDVSGDPDKMRAFFQWAEQFAGRGLNDLFLDTIGYSYDRGKKWNKTIGGHEDHVHFSV